MPNTFNSKIFLQNVTAHPGVYQMFGEKEQLLYVGKAGNLKKRLGSYFRKTGLSVKNQLLMAQVEDIRTIVTHSETEALILENNLIKKSRPKYNILLRDDKTYPYIHLTEEAYPRLKLFRGSRKAKGKFFGPYPNVGAAKETLDTVQKVFLIRNCNNTFFKNRSRPCLQYQIKRCSAPCMDIVDAPAYRQQIDEAVAFLEGKNDELAQGIEEKMTAAATQQDFEVAIFYRNKLQSLRKVLEKQYISNEKGDADVIAIVQEASLVVIQIFYYRSGRSLGTQFYAPKIQQGHCVPEILQSFIEQIYFDKAPPKELIINEKPENTEVLKRFFFDRFGVSVKFSHQPREHRARWLKLALDNANLSLYQQKISTLTLSQQFVALDAVLGVGVGLLACVDVSHTQGEATVASYVVFDKNGPKKSDYRKYNIKGITGGDDYAAMKQLLQRRFSRFLRQADNPDITEKIPDVLFVDGGKGQFQVAKEVFLALGVTDVLLVGVAKGSDRKAGMERLIIGNPSHLVRLGGHHPAMHLIQQIRDESHRFAITGHRKKRDKKRFDSVLQEIEGIGNKRRQSLLKYFAGIKGLKSASAEDLQKVDGISPKLATKIYDYFH